MVSGGRSRRRRGTRRGAGDTVVGRNVTVVLAVGRQVVCVEAVAALIVAAHVAPLRVVVEVVEIAARGERTRCAAPANPFKKEKHHG